MRRFEFEGLIGFDCGDVVGEDCLTRQRGSCRAVPGEVCEYQCWFCLFSWTRPTHIDAYRRWEAAGCPVEEGVS